MVVKRFLACFYPPYEYRRTRAELLAEGERFYAAGRTVLQQGWRKVQDSRDEDEADEQAVPLFHRGDVYTGGLVQCKALKTAPPARYTEATLLSAMENPSPYIDDKQMKEFIGGGLGTPATRADIIEKLFSAFYVEKRGCPWCPRPRGRRSSAWCPPT